MDKVVTEKFARAFPIPVGTEIELLRELFLARRVESALRAELAAETSRATGLAAVLRGRCPGLFEVTA